MNLIYYIFLLLIIFLLLMLLRKNNNLSPKKIKIYMAVVISLFLIRYIALFLLCIVKSGVYLHLFKSLLFLNNLAIPLIVLALDYVFLRWNKLSFSINYIIAAILVGLYCVGMYFTKIKIIFNIDYGYIINVKNEIILYLGSLIIVGILLIFTVYFLDKPNCNKMGLIYVISALIIVILENVIHVGGVRYFPYPIIGDGIFVLLMNLCMNTFKVKR